MNKLIQGFFFISVILILTACKKDNNEDITKTPNIVINEIMPANSSTAHDQNGEFDDWIELYNLSDSTINVSGYYLSDSKSNQTKWSFPTGTEIQSDSFLIVWIDNDTLQTGLHANFKLSSLGETVILLNADVDLLDMVSYGEQPVEIGQPLVEKSFARIPNGTGAFSWVIPTFNSTNK
jgi:hypothetical protein